MFHMIEGQPGLFQNPEDGRIINARDFRANTFKIELGQALQYQIVLTNLVYLADRLTVGEIQIILDEHHIAHRYALHKHCVSKHQIEKILESRDFGDIAPIFLDKPIFRVEIDDGDASGVLRVSGYARKALF